MQLAAIVRKELKLLTRDMHGLAVLFLMPVIFILIMSLAMKDDFDQRAGVQLSVLVHNLASSQRSVDMLAELASHPEFELFTVEEEFRAGTAQQQLKLAEEAVGSDRYHFFLSVSPKAFEDPDVVIADMLVAPGTSKELGLLFAAAFKEAAASEKIELMLEELKAEVDELAEVDLMGLSAVDDEMLLSVRYGFQSDSIEQAPTSVQQNVPAWLVFSMFFVVVPLANTLINERKLGTLRRIHTIGVANWKLIVGKIIPYFFINQVQVVLMLIVGVFVVPALGGDRLTLGSSTTGLILMASTLSIAALGFAMLIAVISHSTEQATTLGGASNIILAALGGIMVPAFVMPQFMQTISVVSPMSWGLQGFLDIFSRGGGVAEVWPEALSLVALGLVTLGIALIIMNRQPE